MPEMMKSIATILRSVRKRKPAIKSGLKVFYTNRLFQKTVGGNLRSGLKNPHWLSPKTIQISEVISLLTLAHLGINVKNCENSCDFYCRVLNCSLEGSWQTPDIKAIELHSGSLIIELLEYLSPQKQVGGGTYDHLAFRTDNIEAQIQQLKKLGVEFETSTPRQLMNGKKIIFFHGPDGERIELVQEP